MDTNSRREALLSGLRGVQPAAISVTAKRRLEPRTLHPDRGLPLVVTPDVDRVDAVEWVREHREEIERILHRAAAILFRGFLLGGLDRFRQFVDAFGCEPIEYTERSSPRTELAAKVYSSTDYPPAEEIAMHNEQSYTLNWPMKLWFHCRQPAETGGGTPVADSRRILAQLPPDVVARFRQHGVMYVRNYGQGLGLSWQTAFQTTSPEAVNAHCRANDIQCEWRADDRLRTIQVRPAVRRHPATGEESWFNHAMFFHVSSLRTAVRDGLRSAFSAMEMPSHTCYGDGSEIEEEGMTAIASAYAAERVTVPWQQDDVLLVDNMLAAHGREPFTGPRSVAVAMAEPWREIAVEGVV